MFSRVEKHSWGMGNWVHLRPEEHINPCFKQHLLWREHLPSRLGELFPTVQAIRRLFCDGSSEANRSNEEKEGQGEKLVRGEGCPCFRV